MVSNYCKTLPCVAFAGVMALAVSCHSATAAAGISSPAAVLYSQLETFHGHVCAGSIFGARLGLAAREALRAVGGTGEFTARYYELSCPVDGSQMTAGKTWESAAPALIDREEHRLVLTAAGNGRQVEARLTGTAEELGLRSRELREKAAILPSGTTARLQLEREIEAAYVWLKTAPTEAVVIVTALNGKKSSC